MSKSHANPNETATLGAPRTLGEIMPAKKKDIQMTREELKDKLNKMSDKVSIDFVKDYCKF